VGARVRGGGGGGGGEVRRGEPETQPEAFWRETDRVTHVVLMQDLEHFVDVIEGVHPGGPSLFGLQGHSERERGTERERQ